MSKTLGFVRVYASGAYGPSCPSNLTEGAGLRGANPYPDISLIHIDAPYKEAKRDATAAKNGKLGSGSTRRSPQIVPQNERSHLLYSVWKE